MMGFVDNIKDKAEDAVEEAKDNVDEAVDKAKDTVEDKTGVDVDEAVDKAQSVVDEAQDRAGEAVDEAKDVVDEASEGDVDEAVDEAKDVGGAVSGGGSNPSGVGGGSTNFGGSSSGAVSSPGSKTDEDVRNNVLTPFKNKSDKKNLDNLDKETVDKQLNRIEGDSLAGQQQDALNPALDDFLRTRKKNLEAEQALSKTRNKIENAPGNARFKTRSGEVVSKSEAIDKINTQKKSIEEDIEQNTELYRDIALGKNDDNGITKSTLIDIAEGAVNLDKGGRPNRQEAMENLRERVNTPGKSTRTDLPDFKPENDPGNDLEEKTGFQQNLDVFMSDRGFELLSSYVPENVPVVGSDPSPDDVIRNEVATRKVENKEPSSIERAFQSPASLLVGGAAGGLAFKGLVRGGSAVAPSVGSAIQTTGRALGAAEIGRVGGKSAKDFSQGESLEGTERILRFGTASAGFVAGGKGFNKRFGPRAGSTSVNQKNLFKAGGEKGFGRFQASTNIVKPRVRDIVRTRGNDPKVTQQVTTGKYNTFGSTSKGRFFSQSPSGSRRSGIFETVSVPKKSGRNTRTSTEVVRTEENNVLFRNVKDSKTDIKTVVNNRGSASASEVARSFDNVGFKISSDIRKIELSTVNNQGDEFGSATTFVLNARSGSGGSATGISQGRRSEGFSSGSGGGGQRTVVSQSSGVSDSTGRIRRIVDFNQKSFRDLAQSQAKKTAQNQRTGNTFGLQFDFDSRNQRQVSQTSGVENTQEFVESQGFVSNSTMILDGSDSSQVTGRPDSGQKELERVRNQSTTVVSGGSVEDTKENFVVGKDLKSSLTQENVLKQTRGKGNKLIEKRFSQFGKQFKQGLSLDTGLVNQLRFSQRQKTGLKQRFTAGFVQTPVLTSLPGATGLSQAGFRPETGFGPGVQKSDSLKFRDSEGLATDWFSANLVEQKTGQQAVFPLNPEDQEGFLTGVKTVQESSGQVEPDKITSKKNDNGGTNIW